METGISHETNSREQVKRAIEFRDPDYVPSWLNFYADETLDRYGTELAAMIAEHVDDVVVTVLSTFPPMSEMPQGWPDEWGCRWNNSPDGVGAVAVDSPIHDSWDRLDRYLEQGLPELESRTDILDRVTEMRSKHPDRYLMATTYLAIFERLRCLRGAENLMTDFYLFPEKLSVLRDALVAEFVGQIRGIGARGADAVLLADDFGMQHSMLISPKTWREFFKASYRTLVEVIHGEGMHAWFHSCGHIRPIIPDLIEAGFDLLHPLQPSAMDIQEIADTFGGQICFAGGIDVQAVLPTMTATKVEREVQRVIETLNGPHGGYIMAPTNSIMPDTPLENIRAMLSTAKRYGSHRTDRLDLD